MTNQITDSNLATLQTFLCRNITIPGSKVIPVGLFNVLDGRNPEDYIARVEPSPFGADKMANYILSMIDQSERLPGAEGIMPGGPSSPPTTSYMGDRM